MPNRYFVALFVAIASVTLSAQSQFGNNKVLAGSTCPPVSTPLGGAGTLYTCTGTGALYTWTGSAWVAAGGGGGGTPSAPDTGIQVDNAGSFGASAFGLMSPTTGHMGLGTDAAIDSGAMNGWAGVNAVIGIQNNRTSLAASTISTNIFNSNDLTPAADIVGARRHTGQYNDVRFLGTKNAANTEFYGVLSDLTMNAAGTALWAFGNQGAVYVMDDMGNITEVYGTNNYIYSQSVAGNITNAYGVSAYPMQHYGGGTVTNSYGVYVWPVAGSGTITNNIAIWSSAQARTGTCSYNFWADDTGVYAIKADNTFNSVYQSSPRLYNPQFTKYTPCATNHERVVQQWESNVAVLTTEAGGTGVLRSMRIGDTGVSVEYGAILNGTALKTDTTTAHTALIQAYDVDGTAYKTFATLTNGNTPNFDLSAPSGGTLTSTNMNLTTPTITTSITGGAGLTIDLGTANVWQQYNSTTAQTLYLYNTRTDASNYERFGITWTSNILILSNFNAGSGSARSLIVRTADGQNAVSVPSATSGSLQFANYSQSSANANGQVRVPGNQGVTPTSGTHVTLAIDPNFNPSSTSTMVSVPLKINPTINYSAGTPGAGSYEALKIAVTETALPTGTNYLIRASAGAAGTTDELTLTNGGDLTATGVVRANGGYKSSDGSAGITGSTCTAWKNGLCTSS